jgi:sulfur carrier protein ThiS
MTFCTDIDLLHWEPNLLREASFASQTLLSGTGQLSGTSFTLDSGSFLTSHVEPGQVIVLSGPISGCFPIVSVESETELMLSVLYDQLGIGSDSPQPSPIATASNVSFVVRTFWPQRRVSSELLTQSAGVDDPAKILNPHALRRACVLGTLQLIYSALAAAAQEPAAFIVRADLYERLYRRALRKATLDIDTNADGETDTRRNLNVLELRRV